MPNPSSVVSSLHSPAANPSAGYLCLSEDGGVFCFGNARFRGSAAGVFDAACALAADPGGKGYWVATRRGHVAAFGVPDIVGSDGASSSSEIVDLACDSSGKGLWVLDRAGGVFCFGSAEFQGSVPGLGLEAPIEAVAMAATPDDGGYWVIDRVGGVFCFGNAEYFGSVPELGAPTAPAVAIVGRRRGDGYTVVAEDGTTFAFGRAPKLESVAARHPIVGAAEMLDGMLLVDAEGVVYPLGLAPFLGSPATLPLTTPVVDIASSGTCFSG